MKEIADEKLQQARESICIACPQHTMTAILGLTCGKFLHKTDEPKTCGCLIGIKKKLAHEHCPQLKW